MPAALHSLSLPLCLFTVAPAPLHICPPLLFTVSPKHLHSPPPYLFTVAPNASSQTPAHLLTVLPSASSQLPPAPLHSWSLHLCTLAHSMTNFFQPNSRAPLPLFILFAQTWSLLPRCGLFLPRILPPTPVLCSTITHAFLGYVHT